jgi:hypothetical protein
MTCIEEDFGRGDLTVEARPAAADWGRSPCVYVRLVAERGGEYHLRFDAGQVDELLRRLHGARRRLRASRLRAEAETAVGGEAEPGESPTVILRGRGPALERRGP